MARAHQFEELNCDTPVDEAARGLLQGRWEAVRELCAKVVEEPTVDAIHDARVATRRLRSAYRDFRPFVRTGALRRVMPEIRALADLLGAVRDQDVAIATLDGLADGLGPGMRRDGLLLLAAERRPLRNTAAEQLMLFLGDTELSSLNDSIEKALAAISALPDFRRLMQAACLRVGQLLNQTELGRDVGLPQPTVHRWLNLLETSYLLVRLPAYAVNRTKRLVTSPRIFWGDTGVALHLGAAAPAGAHLENLVLHDLIAWRDARVERVALAYWRTTIGEEVDFVIEAGGKLLPIEVKATSRPRLADCAHLRTFRQEYGRKVRAGLLLHTGRTVEWLTPDVLAVPWWRVL